MPSAGGGPLCFIKSKVSHLPGDYHGSMLPLSDKVFGDADFLFQQDVTCP